MADNSVTPENEATAPQYRLVTGGYQPFSLLIDGNVPSPSDAFRITNFIRTASNHTVTWQSVKGMAYLLERSTDLQTWETYTAALGWYNPASGGTPPALLVTTATDTTKSLSIPVTATGARLYYRIREAGMP